MGGKNRGKEDKTIKRMGTRTEGEDKRSKGDRKKDRTKEVDGERGKHKHEGQERGGKIKERNMARVKERL